MKEFNTSLLREKFVINDPNVLSENKNGGIVALSNRAVIELRDSKNTLKERFIVRAQNMHSCIRMIARIMQSFTQGGPILNRHMPYDWESSWDSIVNSYEHTFNPNRWVTVYNAGKPVFKYGDVHPLLDLIEKCHFDHKGEYDEAVKLAEDAFKKTGKVVKIDYDGNVALVVNYTDREAKNSVILRRPDRTTTFSFSTMPKDEKALNFSQCLTSAAAFLEGMQLAFMVGMNTIKIHMGHIDRHSDEERQTREAKRRLSQLNAEIANLESAYDVRYRPERPELQKVVMDAEKLAVKILKPVEDKSEQNN
ncbi:MAG: hypothetical protein AAF244_04430 [Pseudomonadota bacterium]